MNYPLSPVAQGKLEILNYSRLPARLTMEQTAILLCFQNHDIPVLVKNDLLKPLGSPASNAPKYFATIKIQLFADDENWLSKASSAVSENWRLKNQAKSHELQEQNCQ